MRQLQCLLYKNRCYAAGKTITPTHIVVHSTGANNDSIARYVQPHDSQTSGMEEYKPVRKTYTRNTMLKILGKNRYGNHWNRDGDFDCCVHAFIGRLADGSIAVVQTLPWKMRPWGCGRGSKGSYNDCAIQFEICEDDHESKEYCTATFKEAAELCAHLCKSFGIPVENIVSHKEAAKRGYASNHGDPDNWWPKHGLSMAKFRNKVAELLSESEDAPTKAETPKKDDLYRIRTSWENKSSQVGAYAVRENAVKACPVGYTVYDSAGTAVYTNKKEASNTQTTTEDGLEPAKSKNTNLAGTYIVEANGGLNLRLGPGTDRKSVEVMPNGSRVSCYGYYTGEWLYVVSASRQTGFAHRGYLVKAD